MSKFQEYLEATKTNKTAGIPAIKEHLKYIERYIDKANQTPGVLQSLEDIKKRMMKTSIARPEGHVTKKQIALNEAKAKEISKNLFELVSKQGGYDYINKTYKLGLSKSDKEKDYDNYYLREEDNYMDDYGLDDTDDTDDKEIKKTVDDLFNNGRTKAKYGGFDYLIYENGLTISLKLFQKLGLDEDGETTDLEVALKAYKTITGKEYK